MNNITWKYSSKLIKETVIEEFEKEMNISLPHDLKECFKKNNGGMPSKNIFDTDKTKGRMFNNLLSFNLNKDEDTIYDIYSAVYLKLKNKDVIPFALDPFGNILCLKEGKIVLFLHETGGTEFITDSFSELLEKLYD